jgi:hypothetical protein
VPDENPLGFVPGNNQPSLPNIPPPPNTAPQFSPAQQMSQQLQNADTQHHSALGKAFRSIMGNDVSYQIDPQTGKMVQQETPQKPGQFWRGILAATVLGGATAAKNKAPGFMQGAAEGGEAAIDKAQQQDQLKQQQAQEQFKDQLAARSANTEEDLKRMQIAHINAQTLRENQIMQRTDYDFHKDIGEQGLKDLQPFIDADPKLVKFKDIDEADKNELLKNNPQALHLMWRPTGTKIVFEDNGKPNVHATYTGVDPEGNIKLTDDQIKHLKEVGVEKYLGASTWGVLTKDKELNAKQYIAVMQHAKTLNNELLINKKAKFDEEKEQASIDLVKAQASHFKAEASKLYSDEADKKAALEAFDILSSGKDVSKLSIKGREALSKGLTDIVKTNMAAIKDLPKDATGQLDKEQQDKAGELYDTAEKYQKILDRLYGIKPTEKPTTPIGEGSSTKIDNAVQIMTDDTKIGKGTIESYNYIQTLGLSQSEKEQMAKQTGAVVPWTVVETLAKRNNVTQAEAAKRMKKDGYTVQADPRSTDKSFNPDDLTTD